MSFDKDIETRVETQRLYHSPELPCAFVVILILLQSFLSFVPFTKCHINGIVQYLVSSLASLIKHIFSVRVLVLDSVSRIFYQIDENIHVYYFSKNVIAAVLTI